MVSPTTRLYLSFLATAITVAVVKAYPPEDAVKCSGADNTDCTLANAYSSFPDRTPCRTAAAAFPASESELIATVAAATRRGQKMKASPQHSHSIPRLACPGGGGLAVSTARMAAVLGVDAAAGTVTAEAGATLRAVMGAAAAAGLAVPQGPYWWGVTLGGMLGSGAHGSSLWGKGGAVHEYVAALTVVSPGEPHEGFVRVRRLVAGRDDAELDAVKVALGVLGVISQVTLKVQPMFKRSITYVTKKDTDLGDKVLSFGREHEFADIIWYPSQRKAVYRVDDRVPVNTPGNGLYDFIPFRSTSTSIISTVRTTEENEEFLNDDEGKCISAKIVTSTLSLGAYGLTNNGMTFSGYPVIGFQNRMQSSGTCLDSKAEDPTTACPWDPRAKGESFHQTTFSLALTSAKPFIEDVQALVSLEPRALCGTELYNGILIRYVTASSAYLGKDSDSVDFDITYFRHGSQLDDDHYPSKPRLHEDVLEEIEQMAVLGYGALPHWGKNRNVAFLGAAAKYENLTRFLRVKDKFDPLGLFSSDWSDQVLGIKDGLEILEEGCALEGLCICKEDIHCAPREGYFCRPGRVYKKARVCRLDANVHF